MAKLNTRRFVPNYEEQQAGLLPMTQEEILVALEAYKKQNPDKYAAKKEALFKRYGFTVEQEVETAPDAETIELQEITKKVKAKKNAK